MNSKFFSPELEYILTNERFVFYFLKIKQFFEMTIYFSNRLGLTLNFCMPSFIVLFSSFLNDAQIKTQLPFTNSKAILCTTVTDSSLAINNIINHFTKMIIKIEQYFGFQQLSSRISNLRSPDLIISHLSRQSNIISILF